MGATLVICGRDLGTLEQTAGGLSGAGIRTLPMRCDVRSEDEVNDVVRRTVEELGRLDVLVNNAGTVWAGAPEDVPLSGWQKVVDVNLTGLFLFCRAAAR